MKFPHPAFSSRMGEIFNHIYDINFLISSWVNPVISMMVFSSIPFANIFLAISRLL